MGLARNLTCLLVIYGVATVYFGAHVVRIIPPFVRLLVALWAGAVRWPGPRIHDPGRSAGRVRAGLGVGYENLFSTFTRNSLSVVAALFYSVGAALTHTPLLSPYITIKWPGLEWVFLAVVLAGGGISARQVRRNLHQVNRVLSDLATGAEPQAVNGRSAEAEYAIEHPLIKLVGRSEGERAPNIFYESVRCHQDGNEQRALALYQEAMGRDLSLHERAREALAKMLHGRSPEEAGPIVRSPPFLNAKQGRQPVLPGCHAPAPNSRKDRGSDPSPPRHESRAQARARRPIMIGLHA